MRVALNEIKDCAFACSYEWEVANAGGLRALKSLLLGLKTPFHECPKGRYKIAVKVVDIFGNDTMKIVEVGI